MDQRVRRSVCPGGGYVCGPVGSALLAAAAAGCEILANERAGRSFAVLAMAFLVVALAGSTETRADEAREIGGNKQLFIDEDMVEQMEGVRFTLNPARRGERVLTATESWETAGIGYVTVIKDGDLFRMWYSSWHYEPTIKGHWMDRVAYAESEDGITWRKPRLGQYEFNGSKDNNLIAVGKCGYAHGTSVFIDPNARSPAERYKMVFGDFYRVYPYPGCPTHTSISGAISADGVDWQSIDTPHGLLFPSGGTDTQNVTFWDPYHATYVTYYRYNHYRKDENGKVIGPASRRIARSVSPEFRNFPHGDVIAAPDDGDPGGQWGSGLYNSAATIYPFAPGVYLFFPTVHHYDTGLCEIHFASSRDGVHLDRRFREPYVAVDPNARRLGKQIAYTAYMGPGMTRVGDEIWMYGTEQDTPHDGAWHGRRVPSGVHRYVQRLDGFVSLDAGSTPGSVITKPFVLRGEVLEINADATFSPGDEPYREESSITLSVLTADRQVLAESEPIRGDGVALEPVWKGGKGLADHVGKAVQLRFTLYMAKLYAFEIADAEPVPVQLPSEQ